MRSLCFLACWALVLAGAEARVHATRDQAQARQVVEMRSFDMWALDASEVKMRPFPHLILEKFVPKGKLAKINADFPKALREHVMEDKDLVAAGDLDSAFTALLMDANSVGLRDELGFLFGVDLSETRTRVSVRGACVESCNGTVRVDAKWKAMTVHIFLNEEWKHHGDAGHLRLLKGPHIDRDAVVQIPSWRGNLVAWVNTQHAWNGFLPYRGQRRALMINYIWAPGVSRNPREHLFHRHAGEAHEHPLLPHLPLGLGESNSSFKITKRLEVPPPPPAGPPADEAAAAAAAAVHEEAHAAYAAAGHTGEAYGGEPGAAGAAAAAAALQQAQAQQQQQQQAAQVEEHPLAAAAAVGSNHPLAQQVVLPWEEKERSFSGFSVRTDVRHGITGQRGGFTVHGPQVLPAAARGAAGAAVTPLQRAAAAYAAENGAGGGTAAVKAAAAVGAAPLMLSRPALIDPHAHDNPLASGQAFQSLRGVGRR